MRCALVLLLATLACLCACKRDGGGAEVALPATPDVSLFSDAFHFACSPSRDVGCEGVFEVRRPEGDFPTTAAVLWSGEDALRARMELLERAKRSIRIQALIFRGDEVGLHISEALKKKRKQGVDVRVIVDALSNLDAKTQWMYFDLKQHGVEVEGYEALYLNWLTADLRPDDPFRPNKRFHDKMWVVDGEDLPTAAAIVGGLNIANEYFRVGVEPIDNWRDQDVLLEGAIVKDVVRAFDRNYDYFKGLKERLPAIFNPDNSWKLTRAVLDAVAHLEGPDWRRPHIVAKIERALAERPRVEKKPVIARFLQSRPRFEETFISQAYLSLIKNAKERIIIANAYFVPPRVLIDALKDAARRGVKVQILTNSPETNDIAPVATISRHIYFDLLSVNLVEGSRSREEGRALEIWEWVGPAHNEGTLHEKVALFDDAVAVVGSYNLDPRSERLNSETAVALHDEELVVSLRAHFEARDLAKSRPIHWEEAQQFKALDETGKAFELLFALPMKGWL